MKRNYSIEVTEFLPSVGRSEYGFSVYGPSGKLLLQSASIYDTKAKASRVVKRLADEFRLTITSGDQ